MDESANALHNMMERLVGEGEFAGQPGGDYRPDATAWAILALDASDEHSSVVAACRDRLVRSQAKDGRISFHPDYPQAYWPTSEAILAWHGSEAHAAPRQKAIEFLLRAVGKHFPKDDGTIVGHDPSIKGWPWIDGTHSWVEPTAMALLALEVSGAAQHPRAVEGRRMLLNRQLSLGGWNYGNTTTYCVELRPSMESTGLALQALAGHTRKDTIQKSLDYFDVGLPTTYTPLWLAWTLFALGAWNAYPTDAAERVTECLRRQSVYGKYDTTWIAVVLLTARCEAGLIASMTKATKIKEVV